MAEVAPLRFFIDHCVPDSVGRVLADAGYEVILLRERLAANAPDPLVAAFSEMMDAVLVSLDTDFAQLAPRAGVGRRRFQRLSRVGMRCSEPQAAERVRKALSLIEHEWRVTRDNPDRRMIVEVGQTSIRTLR